jgi:hypothetical protein
MGKFKIQKSATVNVGFNFNGTVDSSVIGSTGGNTNITGSQIQVYANIAAFDTNGDPDIHSVSTAYIVAGRGRGKFLVNDGTYQGVCQLVDKIAANLLAGEMSNEAYRWNGNNISTLFISRMSNKFVWDFATPLPNKYLYTGGEALSKTNYPQLPLDVVHIDLT